MLKTLIDTLCTGRKFHICIHDVSGVLTTEQLNVPPQNKFHSKKFCDIAKQSRAGFEECMRCKGICNNLSLLKKSEFRGYCPFGLYEYVKPVVIDGSVVCIIYVGNILKDKNTAVLKLEDIAKRAGANQSELKKELCNAQSGFSDDFYIDVCNILEKYIQLLYKKSEENGEYHWAVNSAVEYIQLNFKQNITLNSVAKLYYINEKYLGRIFKRQVGISFHRYLLIVRLNACCEELLNSKKSILSIALDNGFQTVTYFNRVFLKEYGIAPRSFRSQKNNKVLEKLTV